MPGESTHRSIPTEKQPEQEAEETRLPGPGRTSGVGDGEGRLRYLSRWIRSKTETRTKSRIEDEDSREQADNVK